VFTVPVPYQYDQELHLWRTVQELGGPSSYVFTALERIRGQCMAIFTTPSHRLYLQMMRRLPETHPWLYRMYTEKKMHAVQRTGHALNGLWTDLTIEQVLMASMKSRGDLTHGRGLTV